MALVVVELFVHFRFRFGGDSAMNSIGLDSGSKLTGNSKRHAKAQFVVSRHHFTMLSLPSEFLVSGAELRRRSHCTMYSVVTTTDTQEANNVVSP